jgi:hypothetical protein
MILLEALAAYGVIGIVIAPVFVVFGIPRVMPHASATIGARLILVPGAAALWPLVLARWLKSRGRG